MKIPMRASELTQILGQPGEFQVHQGPSETGPLISSDMLEPPESQPPQLARVPVCDSPGRRGHCDQKRQQ
jgi:hypothetical protein